MIHHLHAASGAGPIDAGLGMTHADTVVATAEDTLTISPPADFSLTVGKASTSGPVADLGLTAGAHAAQLRVDGASREIRLLLIDPSRLCRRFGARYGSLEYDLPVVVGPDKKASWESLWKMGPVADIVVDFDTPYKFILWRGMSFAPSWAMGNVLTSNFFAESVEPGIYRDCCEMMSDRQCRYVHARVIHSTDARVVIHWRYPLNDSDYAICRDQWVDEMFYIYPDGVAVRNVTIHLDPDDEAVWQQCPQTGRRMPISMLAWIEGKRAFSNMEFITVHPPGATADDNLPPEAFTLLDGGDFAETYRWPSPPDFSKQPQPKLDEYIFRINYRRRPGVFLASPPEDLRVLFQPNVGMKYLRGERVEDDAWTTIPGLPSNFSDYIHWPITRGYGTCPMTDPAQHADRPTHTFLGYAGNAPVEVREDGAVTWSWLCGIAPEDDHALRAKANRWLHPAEIRGATYDPRQAAYVVAGGASERPLTVEGPRAAARPTLVAPGRDNATVEADTAAAVGVERDLDGVRTVVTFGGDLAPGATIRIR